MASVASAVSFLKDQACLLDAGIVGKQRGPGNKGDANLFYASIQRFASPFFVVPFFFPSRGGKHGIEHGRKSA
jgi:hypothetical protein